MKHISITVLLLFSLFIQNAIPQASSLQNNLQQADYDWKNNKVNQAIRKYQKIIEKENIPAEYQSLVFLRLANAQYQAGQIEECRKTLSEIKSLQDIPPHHRLKAAELEKELEGAILFQQTPVPVHTDVIATFHVSSTVLPGEKNSKTGFIYHSISQAMEAAGVLLKRNDLSPGAIEIIIDDDVIELEKPVQINSAHSGTIRNPIIIRSAKQGKQVLVNCGKILQYWKKETDPVILSRLPEIVKKKIWVADLEMNGIKGIDSLVFGGFSSRRAEGGNARFKTFPVPELFLEGQPQQMARWPNRSDTLVALSDFKDTRSLNWELGNDVWLHGYWYYLWADAYEKISSISSEDTLIKLEPPLNRYGFAKSKWHVVNALSEIDMPGEWCISIKEGKIWYFPLRDSKPENCIMSLAGPAFQVENCNYLTIKDIEFRYIRGDGLVFKDCSFLTVSNCKVHDASGAGIIIDGGSSHLIHSCEIKSMGRGGIDIKAGVMQSLTASGSIIENCKISDLSRIDRTYTPAILLEGVGIKVRNCLFSDIPSSAIRLEGNDMLIEMNEFTKCVIESDDQGAIDVWGNPLYRGNVIRWNYFHDIGIPNLHMAAGIRLDDAICGFGIYENLFLRSSNNQFGGIQIHGGKDNYIEGNIFADCHAAISQTAWGQHGWESALNDTAKPMNKALKKNSWQSDLWQNSYPSLKGLYINADRNFAIDNLAINAKSLILRKSKKFETLNNEIIKHESDINGIPAFKKYFLPWQKIPIEKIGPYPVTN